MHAKKHLADIPPTKDGKLKPFLNFLRTLPWLASTMMYETGYYLKGLLVEDKAEKRKARCWKRMCNFVCMCQHEQI